MAWRDFMVPAAQASNADKVRNVCEYLEQAITGVTPQEAEGGTVNHGEIEDKLDDYREMPVEDFMPAWWKGKGF